MQLSYSYLYLYLFCTDDLFWSFNSSVDHLRRISSHSCDKKRERKRQWNGKRKKVKKSRKKSAASSLFLYFSLVFTASQWDSTHGEQVFLVKSFKGSTKADKSWIVAKVDLWQVFQLGTWNLTQWIICPPLKASFWQKKARSLSMGSVDYFYSFQIALSQRLFYHVNCIYYLVVI